ncbi:hypothetical protein FQR65_LT10102 [Abscondita terminalis]|nr:hypothetical protein FQR65_LT10102 [Abscondita terminalis]
MTDAAKADCISWDDYFMAIGFLSAQRSKDPVTQVGACIVRNNVVVGTGYNGMPNGDDSLPWSRPSKNDFVCHAEMNAITNTYLLDFKDCVIYVTLFPCNECAKLIIKSGIKKIVYNSDLKNGKRKNQESKMMLKSAGVECRQYSPSIRNINIFSKIDVDGSEKLSEPSPKKVKKSESDE